jgi:hypothetical protein
MLGTAVPAVLVLILLSPRGPLAQTAGEQPAVSPAPLSSVTKDGTPTVVIDDQDIDSLLGKNVRSVAGEDMGRVVDVLVVHGQVRAVVIDFGGFLGVGSRKVAVDWLALRLPESGKLDRVTLELTRDQVRAAPEYRPGAAAVIVGAVGAARSEPASLAPRPEK